MKTIDLNADMGESFGKWAMGDDRALLDIVTSANIACGFHAGDPDTMINTMKAAHDRGVGIGAHPGFNDKQGFGRFEMKLPMERLGNLVRYQVAAAHGMAQSIGAKLSHVKLHGALANMAAADEMIARCCLEATLSVAPETTLLVMAATKQEHVAKALGAKMACEIFADRAYNDDGSLVSRALEGAIIHDPELAAKRTIDMIKAGAIISINGKKIPTRIDTICLHGDTQNAILIAKHVKQAIEKAGIQLAKF